MITVIVPHIDPLKHGATEHVDAIVRTLRWSSDDNLVIADPLVNLYEGEGKDKRVRDLTVQLKEIKQQYEQGGAAVRFVAVTGDYGGERRAAETIKHVLGQNTQVLMSSYTVEMQTVQDALEGGWLNYLAVPRHAIDADVLRGTRAEKWIASFPNLIPMTGVPHLMTPASLDAKRSEWDQAAREGKVAPLPDPLGDADLAAIVIPGDVEGPDGRAKLFTVDDARLLANAIVDMRKGKPTIFLVSNGPRTGKFNTSLVDLPDFKADEPKFQNTRRLADLQTNLVAGAFLETLTARVGAENIINGCIQIGKVPPQGFLAFYAVLNARVAAGLPAGLFIDGVSTTMMTQAVNVLDPHVALIACDTAAKNTTHIAGLQDLYGKGYVSQLALSDGRYVFCPAMWDRATMPMFDDAAVVAESLLGSLVRAPRPQKGPVPKGRVFLPAAG